MRFPSFLSLLVVAPAAAFVPSRPTTTETALNVQRNANFAKLAGGYLFPEIGRRRTVYVAEHPFQADRIVSLGIGDTTLPIPSHILDGLKGGAAKLGDAKAYSGYGDVQGRDDLRAKSADTLYNGIIDGEEVFVSGMYFQCVTDAINSCVCTYL